MEYTIPLAGISVGIIVPLAVFYWLYHESKNKNETIVEISRNLDDQTNLKDCLASLTRKKKEPIDYRRGGLITIFVGMGIYFLGLLSLGSFLKE